MDKNFYFFVDTSGKQHGPVRADYFKSHGIAPDTLIWFSGLPTWVEARDITHFKNYLTESGVESHNQPSHYHDYINSRTPGGKVNLGKNAEQPKTWITESILLMLFCSFIPGAVALFFASKVESRWAKNDYVESIRASKIASNWVKWGFTLTIIIITIYLILSIFMPWTEISVLKFNKYFNM